MRANLPILCAALALLFAGLAAAAVPYVAVIQPNGGEFISQIDGNYQIDFNVSDADNDALWARIYYGTAPGSTANEITPYPPTISLEDASICTDSDGNNITQNACSWSWNTAGINGSSYYVTVFVFDVFSGDPDPQNDSSNASFIVDNNAPAVVSYAPAGGWSNDANQAITATLYDAESGINAATIVMNVEGTNYTTASPELDYNAASGLLAFTPSIAFTSGQVVDVAIDVNDAASNAAATASFNFTIDSTPPTGGISCIDPLCATMPAWKTEATLNLTCSDSDSGCASKFYYYFSTACSPLKAAYTSSVDFNGSSYVLNINDTDHNNFLCVWSEDLAGNNDVDILTPFPLRIDRTQPVTATDANAGWQATDANVHLTCTDPGWIDGSGDENGSGCAGSLYRLDTDGSNSTAYGAWLAYDANAGIPVSSDGNFAIQFFSTDNAGNGEATQTAYVLIDKTAPVTTDNAPSGWVNYAVSVAFSCTDAQSGCAATYSQVDGNGFVAGGSALVSADGNHQVDYYSVDAVGNTEAIKTAWVAVDTAVPVTTDNLACPAAWQAADFNITLTVAPDGLSPTTTYYTTDGNAPTTASASGNTIEINTDGNYAVQYFTQDDAGNAEAANAAACFALLDKLPPVTTASYAGGWSNVDVNVVLACSDAGSGCALTQFRKDFNSDSGADFNLGWEIWADGNGILFNADGNWELDFNSTDNAVPAHVEAVNVLYVLIDKTVPSVAITSPAGGSSQTSTDVVVTYTGSDALSGVAGYEVRVDSGAWAANGLATTYTFSSQSVATHTYEVRVTDNAGNTATAAVSVTINSSGSPPPGPPAPPSGGGGSSSGGGGGSGAGDPECNAAFLGTFGARKYLCAADEYCPGAWQLNDAGQTCCLNVRCVNNPATPQETSIATCAEQAGYACGAGEECLGSLLEASDSSACCSAQCSEVQQLSDACEGKSCSDLNPCTVDSCKGGECRHVNVADGTECNETGYCQKGVCVAVGIVEGGLGATGPTGFAILGDAAVIAGLLALALLLIGYAIYRRRKKQEKETLQENGSGKFGFKGNPG